jgi:hypothetical protein
MVQKITSGMLLAASLCAGPVVAQPAFDGVYKGESHRIAGTDSSCAAERTSVVEVRNGRFILAWHEPLTFDVRVRADGRFHATSSANLALAEKRMAVVPTLDGGVNGTTLVADYGTRMCRYQLEATRS